MREHLSIKSSGTLLGIFTSYGCHDDINHRMGETFFKSRVDQMWVGFEGINYRGFEVTSWYTVSMTNQVDGSVVGPLTFQTGCHCFEVVIFVGQLGCEMQGQ